MSDTLDMNNIKAEYAVIMHDRVIFPVEVDSLEVATLGATKSLEKSNEGTRELILLYPKKNTGQEEQEFYPYGVQATIERTVTSEFTGGTRVQISPHALVKVVNVIPDEDGALQVVYTDFDLRKDLSEEELFKIKYLENRMEREFVVFSKSPSFYADDPLHILSPEDPFDLRVFKVADFLMDDEGERLQFLETFSLAEKFEYLIKKINDFNKVQHLENEIDQKLKKDLEKTQRDYFLREKIRVINEELGDGQDFTEDIQEYREKIETGNLPENVKKKLLKELNKLSRINMMSPEYGILLNYLDFATNLPWGKYKEENEDIHFAEKVLNDGHYGLEKVKERILEFLAVQILNKENKGSIICLVGPPGVGKTSLGKSIAEATNRDFVRLSLGGIQDESEIRGHRRTYIGAMPGRIIQGIADCESSNPVFLLDEIDKLSRDFRGDPAAALLEALDPAQNDTFSDHYLEVPFDLSRVLFITTANSLGTIPEALRDRLEIIELESYTEEEKMEIAKRHLIAKQLKAHGLEKDQFSLNDAALRVIIEEYTREAGVRELERKIGSLCRKTARQIVSGDAEKISVTKKNLGELLGRSEVQHLAIDSRDQVGVAVGMAWTRVGGEILHIECQTMPGTGKLTLTGQMGNVMKESAQMSMSYTRTLAKKFKLPKDFYKELDVHLHIPEGAVPKDGPSAGVTLTCAFISAFANIPIKRDVAMTGEMTLRGRVLAVGGIRDKVLAAHRAGCKTVIIPKENKKNVEELPESVREELDIHYADKIEDVLKIALKGYGD